MTPAPSNGLVAHLARPGARQRMVVLALLAMLLPALAVLTASQSAHAAVLLSQGKVTTASSTENGGTLPAAAVDGNTGTRWSSAASDPQWLQVDLGSSQSITQVVLNWETAYGKAFQIQTSTDATNWTSIFSTTTGTGGVQTLNITGTGRYVRMLGTVRATQYGYSLWEFQVYGGTTPPPPVCSTTNAAQGMAATASSVLGGNTAALAVDGNTGSRWESAQGVDPQWISIDLGSTQSICKVVLSWETAAAKNFTIDTATAPGGPWTPIYTTTTGAGGVQTLTVNGSGRYVRMNGTARTTQYGYSLWEFQVFTGSSVSTSPSISTSTSPSITPSTGSDVLLSYNKPAVASTFQNEGACTGCTAGHVTDNDPASRWATSSVNGWVDPGWVYIDLGATAAIHSVMLQWDFAYATSYQVQVSADAVNWTSIYSTTTGKGFKETLTGLNGTGRYVRMYGTVRNSAYGYSLWEFQVFGTGGAPVAPPAPPANLNFPATRLVFADEFNGAAGTTPDPAKWAVETGGGQNGEQQYYTNNLNSKMDGTGDLVIQARKEAVNGFQYTSGRITTQNKFEFTYGHAEARIKVSGTQGLWPAFWLLGANIGSAGWPSCGEIDIMEHVGKVPNAVYSTIHAPAYNGGGGLGSPYTIAGDFASAFHTYAADWNADHMSFYVDGNLFFTLTKAAVEAAHGPWVYDHPFFVILNNAVGGAWPGNPDATTVLPQDMAIDYVRVYQ